MSALSAVAFVFGHAAHGSIDMVFRVHLDPCDACVGAHASLENLNELVALLQKRYLITSKQPLLSFSRCSHSVSCSCAFV